MGRNKLSADDRIKKFNFYEEKVEQCKNGNAEPIMKEIRTLRTKTLRVFCAFWLNQLHEFNLVHDYSIKELSKKIGVGERTIHDYIKARKILSSIDEVSFREIQDNLAKVTSGINKLPPKNPTKSNEEIPQTNKE